MAPNATRNGSPRCTPRSVGSSGAGGRAHADHRRAIASGFAILLALIAVLSLPIGAQRKPPQHPRLANFFLKWHLSEAEARDLARWDILLLDMEVSENTPAAFALLRSQNPNAKLLAYVTSQEIRRDAADLPTSQAPRRRRLAARIPTEWYLRSPNGEHLSWWPQTWLLDVTQSGWTDTLASFVASEIASDARWDGVFYDNLWDGASWLVASRGSIDLDRDGRPEDAETLDARWRDGVRRLLTETRRRTRPGFLIMGNGGAAYADLVNGVLFEHFPETSVGDWSKTMRAYFRVLERAADPVIAVINANTRNTGIADPRRFRFGLTSTLLGGGYYSFDFGDLDHAQRWWFTAYDVSLGEPVGSAARVPDVRNASVVRAASAEDREALARFAPGVYRRDYASGLVLVNATETEQRVQFDEEFEVAVAPGVDELSSGRITSEVILPPQDGAILLRPIAGMRGAPFVNGAFARVFRSDGDTARNGFFASDPIARGGVLVEQRDLDGDGSVESILAEGSAIRVVSGGRVVQQFHPFGEGYRGRLDFAVGDLDQNGTTEVVVTQRDRGSLLGIFNLLEGRRLSPYAAPFGRRWGNGMTVALARSAAASRPEIVVGAGPGAPPEIRTLTMAGRSTGTRFLAYDAQFRGGVHVAAGDVDGDGSDDLVTGAGPGGTPEVRVFSRQLTRESSPWVLQSQFLAFSSERRGGVDVAVADLDGNGIGEILGMSTQAFTIAGFGGQ